MSINPAVLQPAIVLTTGVVAVVTGPVNGQAIIKQKVFTNTTAGAVTITVYRVPNGGTPGTGNIIIAARSIGPAPGTDLAPELANAVLNAGDTIQAEASAGTAINFFASGFVITS